MASIVETRFVLRNDTEANWSAVEQTFVLRKGEPAVSFPADGSAPRLKIGDGQHAWNELPFIAGEVSGEGSTGGSTGDGGGTATLPETFTWNDLNGAEEIIASATTEYLKLTTPASTDPVSLETLNTNFSKIDAAASSLNDNITTLNNTVTTLNDDVAANTAQVASLVSNITDGTTTFDNAEVVDIRTIGSTTYTSAGDAVRSISGALDDLKNNLGDFLDGEVVDGLYYQDNKLYLTSGGNIVGDPVEIVGGSGGTGGGGSTYNITFANLSESRVISCSKGDTVKIKFKYVSEDDEGFSDGAGIGTLTVNSLKKATLSIAQGETELDITNYLSEGENQVKLTVVNSEDNSRSLTYTVNVMVLALTTTFPEMGLYTTDNVVSVPYVLTGAGTKKVNFFLNQATLQTETITTSGKSHTYDLSGITPGAYIFRAYAEAENQGSVIRSNELRLGMLYYDLSVTDPIILINYEPAAIIQGEILQVPYMVYDPYNQETNLTQNIYNSDGSIYSTKTITIDHTAHKWTIADYPIGTIKFELVCGDTKQSFQMEVTESDFHETLITNSLVLNFDPTGRSNNEAEPEKWSFGDVEASFDGFGWTGADGWVEDVNGQTILRFLPGDTMTIPYMPFNSDKRQSGYTIEAILATRDVRDYDTIAIDCADIITTDSGERLVGLRVKTSEAELQAHNSGVEVQFKEDSKVHLTFVVEQQTLNRLIYVYINGVMCGLVQYPANENFTQISPVGISIGSEACGIDLYALRFYNKGFTRHEQLNNYICSLPTLADRKEAYNRNDVLNDQEQVSITTLPSDLPYLILECEELPQYKGDKKKNKSVIYIDPLHPDKCFTADGVQLNVQGTSSQGYPVKNYKVDFKNGITWTESGETDIGAPIRDGGYPSTCWCIKADFASSESANNTCLIEYYEQYCPYENPAQLVDSKVQQGIRGNPIVVFWHNTETDEIKFLGKYNSNHDKSNEIVFGFDREKYPNCESWEFKNNTSGRTLFKRADFDEINAEGEPAWLEDFEARFPDSDPVYTDNTALRRVCEWIVSTDRDAAGLSDEEKAARLQKFKDEIDDYFDDVDDLIYYYIFTECFLMVDSRAKNMFFTTYDGEHWLLSPYDFDTACGINNEGKLAFDYNLEDTDIVDGAYVFNGQTSTLWENIRDAYPDRIKNMYNELRSAGFGYNTIVPMMANHQSIWPEAIWNEDMYTKYIEPLVLDGKNYLEMCLGDKKAHRDFWVYNTFRYRDSKYMCGDAKSNYIYVRGYKVGDLTVTPYSHIYPWIKYAQTDVTMRGVRNTPYTLKCPLDAMNDTEIYIYSADRIANVSGLENLNVGSADFSMATKLQTIVLGSAAEGYQNTQLNTLTIGNNELLTLIDVQNCINLTTPVDASGCIGLETVKAKGSKLTGINLPDGGHLKTLELPASITNFTIKNQKNIETLTFEGQQNITTLSIENTPNLDITSLVNNSPNLNWVRLINVDWTVESEEALQTIYNKLKGCQGLDATGGQITTPVVSGKVNVPSISNDLLEEINDTFPELTIIVNGVAKFFVKFVNYDNTLLYRYICSEGEQIVDPVLAGTIDQPERPDTETGQFTYRGWNVELPITAAGKAYTIVARYDSIYLVRFYDYTKTSLLYSQWVEEGDTVEDPVVNNKILIPTKPDTEKYTYAFSGWDQPLTNIQQAMEFLPLFDESLRSFAVFFMNGSEQLQRSTVLYGNIATYFGDDTEIKKIIDGEPSSYYEFSGWSPSPAETPITTTQYFYAQFTFDGYIEDDWTTIAANAASGNTSSYELGGRKKLSVTIGSETAEYEMEIIGKNHDTLTTSSTTYNGGTNKAALTFMVYQAPPRTAFTRRVLNSSLKGSGSSATLASGGWEICDLRTYFEETFFPALPNDLQAAIKSVEKISDKGVYANPELNTTSDKLWLPSQTELNGGASGADVLEGQGTPYPLFTDMTSRRKGEEYFTRSTSTSIHSWKSVTTNGNFIPQGGGNGRWILFGFCI